METKRMVLYYGVTEEVIGVRECMFDWKEGDEIVTNGVKTEVYAVFDSTEKNMTAMVEMFLELNTKTAMSPLRNFDPEYDDLYYFIDFLDLMDYMVCNKYTVKKREWSDYEKRLDYMEDCFAKVA